MYYSSILSSSTDWHREWQTLALQSITGGISRGTSSHKWNWCSKTRQCKIIMLDEVVLVYRTIAQIPTKSGCQKEYKTIIPRVQKNLFKECWRWFHSKNAKVNFFGERQRQFLLRIPKMIFSQKIRDKRNIFQCTERTADSGKQEIVWHFIWAKIVDSTRGIKYQKCEELAILKVFFLFSPMLLLCKAFSPNLNSEKEQFQTYSIHNW